MLPCFHCLLLTRRPPVQTSPPQFVLVVMLLVFVSFASLVLSAASLDSRLGLTLTVVLGLNVFQIVVIDNTPETGYLTAMHSYCLWSTVLVVLVALENVLAYWCHVRYQKLEQVAALFRRVMGSKDSRRRALMLQERIRQFVARCRERRRAEAGASSVGTRRKLPSNVVAPESSPEAAEWARPRQPAEEEPAAATAAAYTSPRPAPLRRPPTWLGSTIMRLNQRHMHDGQRARWRRRALRSASRKLDELVVIGAKHLDHASFVVFPALFAAMHLRIFLLDVQSSGSADDPCGTQKGA